MTRRDLFDVSDAAKRALSVGVIGGIGIALAGFEVWHTFQMQTIAGKLLEAVLPFGIALVIVYASYWLAQSDFDGNARLRITEWFLAGIGGMAVVAGWIIGHQFVRGVGFHHWHFVTAGAMTVGGVVGFVLGVYDERTTQHRERVVAERRKVEAEQEKLTLLNRILRHNILNAVTVIRGRAETHKDQLDGDGDGEDHRHLDAITSRSDDIVALIEKVHTFIERVSTDGPPDLKPIDLSALLETELEKTRRAYPEARVVGEVPADVRVVADELLAEVFENLLVNAVEHNDADEPVVRVSVEAHGDGVVVSVADNGPGIPDGQKAQLFDWNPETTARPEAGVGLSLVDTLVGQYGGSIWVEDNDPTGAVFRVELRGPPDQSLAKGEQSDRDEAAGAGSMGAPDRPVVGTNPDSSI